MGMLKGRTGFLGRTRDNLQELQQLGETSTKAGLVTLERLTRTAVETHAPDVALVPAARLGAVLGAYAGSDVAARFTFGGSAEGTAGLFLSRQDAVRLAELLLGHEPGSIKRLGEMEQSTIAETANIVLNGCLNALSGHEGVRFKPGVPDITREMKDVSRFMSPPETSDHLVVVDTPFREPARDVKGSFVLVLCVD